MGRTIAGIDEIKSLVGQEVGVSRWYTIGAERIAEFARVTEDEQWIHLDAERAAKESPYGTTIAHGFLTLSFLSEMNRDAVDLQGDYKMRINYGLNRVRFPAAAPAGCRVRGRFVLGAAEDFGGGIQLRWDCTVEVEGQSKPALAAEWLVRVYV
ncbi:MAG: MaoC family dehydratase [Bryobacteraceae bacterium]